MSVERSPDDFSGHILHSSLPQSVAQSIDDLQQICRSVARPKIYVQPYSYSMANNAFLEQLASRPVAECSWKDLSDYCDEFGGRFNHANDVTSQILLPHVLTYWIWSVIEHERSEESEKELFSRGFGSAYLGLSHCQPLRANSFPEIKAAAGTVILRGFEHLIDEIDWQRHATEKSGPLLLSHIESMGCVGDCMGHVVEVLLSRKTPSTLIAAYWILSCFFDLEWCSAINRPISRIPFGTSIAASLFCRLYVALDGGSWLESNVIQLENISSVLVNRALEGQMSDCLDTWHQTAVEFCQSARAIVSQNRERLVAQIARYVKMLQHFPDEPVCSTRFACNQ